MRPAHWERAESQVSEETTMPSISTRNAKLLNTVLTRLEALCDSRPAVECAVPAEAKEAVRLYVQSWVIPVVERVLEDKPYDRYNDRYMLEDAERDTMWREKGAVRCECGQRGGWQHAVDCRIGAAAHLSRRMRADIPFEVAGTPPLLAYATPQTQLSGIYSLPLMFADEAERADALALIAERCPDAYVIRV